MEIKIEGALPCPFCGGEALDLIECDDVFWVQCLPCSVDGPVEDTEALAKMRWNTRP